MSNFDRLCRLKGVAGGAPIVRGRGILAEVIADRFAAGEAIDRIATDYRMGGDDAAVLQSIRLKLLIGSGSMWSQRALKKLDRLVPFEER